MEEENIMTVDIEDFRESQHILDHVDDDFAVTNNLDGIPYNNDTVRLNCLLIAACAEGCIQLDISYRAYQLQASDLLFGLPNTLISHVMLNPKYRIRLAEFSVRFLQRIIKMEKKTWDIATRIHNNPVRSISEGGGDPVFRFHRNLIVARINDEPHYYHGEVVQRLFSALFYEMLGQLHGKVDTPDRRDGPKEGIRQVGYILRKFVELLPKDKGMHYSVSYYADALYYTPRHLSKVIKQACGRAPLDSVNETTIEHIEYRLKRSDKSVKEIAEEFNFPNQSFFGKYVKIHSGTSSANYQNRGDE